MRAWFEHLRIQSKLATLFTAIILLAVFSAGLNVYVIIDVKTLGYNLDSVYQRAGKSYEAHTLLQNLELAFRTYALAQDDRWLHEFENYNARLDDYLRESLMAAEQTEEKAALYEIERAKGIYNETFTKIYNAAEENNNAVIKDLSDAGDREMALMYEQVEWLGSMEDELLDSADETLKWLAAITFAVTTIVMLAFILLSILAAVVITNRVNKPVAALAEAVKAVEERRFDPVSIEQIAQRSDEIGRMAQEFLHMTAAAESREAKLQQEADEIRAKIK